MLWACSKTKRAELPTGDDRPFEDWASSSASAAPGAPVSKPALHGHQPSTLNHQPPDDPDGLTLTAPLPATERRAEDSAALPRKTTKAKNRAIHIKDLQAAIAKGEQKILAV